MVGTTQHECPAPAGLTEPELVGLPLWGLVWFGMDFQESVFPDLESLTAIFDVAAYLSILN